MDDVCCSCQEAVPTVIRLCGHKFCDPCNQLTDKNCRMKLCKKLAKLNEKGIPQKDTATLEQDELFNKLERMENESIKGMEDLAIKQKNDLAEFIKQQEALREHCLWRVNRRLEAAKLELKIAEYRTELALTPEFSGPNSLPLHLYYKASQLTLIESKGRVWNLCERGFIEINEGLGDGTLCVRFGHCQDTAIHFAIRMPKRFFEISMTKGFFDCWGAVPAEQMANQPPHDQWRAPDYGFILGISKDMVAAEITLLGMEDIRLSINQATGRMVIRDSLLFPRPVRWPLTAKGDYCGGLKKVERYKFKNNICSFPDGVRVLFDDPSISPIPDPIKSAPKLNFHEICVQTPSGIQYLQVPRAIC